MAYRATKVGSLLGLITGQRYSIRPGRLVPAPPGDLYGLPGVAWIGTDPEPAPPPPSNLGTEVVLPMTARSTDYTVRQVQNLASGMNREELQRFTQGDHRKTVQRLTN